MKRPAILLALALFILTGGFVLYRILWLGYPVFPTAPGRTWQVTIEARVKPEANSFIFRLGVPSEGSGHMVVEERIASGSLHSTLVEAAPNRWAVWVGSQGQEEIVSYRALIHSRPPRAFKADPPQSLYLPETDQNIFDPLVERWKSLPGPERIRAIYSALSGKRGHAFSDSDLAAWGGLKTIYGGVPALVRLFEAAGLQARTVEGLRLSEGVAGSAHSWVDVWDGQKWVSMGENGEFHRERSLLPLAAGGLPAVLVSGGTLAEIRWIVTRQVESQWRLHFERIRRSDRFLDRWSLFHLPDDFQGTFRILLLVPLGTLIISVLRNIVGFPTFGIFMPVLMALAFRNTGLAYGLGIFGGVLLIGYFVRRWIDKLRLLLVPRMSVMLTLVIACFTFLALLGSKYGWREFMAVGLLPFVILTMVIERFFVLIEEAGIWAALKTSLGSGLVAVIAYGIISWDPLQLTFFVYPELLAAVAGLQILLGRYTGYRLSEWFRFRSLRRP